MNYFIDNYSENKFEIAGDDFLHLKAQRKRVGDILTIVPIKGNHYLMGSIVEITKRSAVLKKVNEIIKPRLLSPEITLYQAIAKKQKMDIILQKATELGVNTIIPIITKNIVPQAEKSNIERWARIVREAAMQSRRFDIPAIETPKRLKSIEWLKPVCCLAEKGAETKFRTFVESNKAPQKIGIIIGAEGGFDDDELELLKQKGVVLASFGSNILRTETAAITAMGVLRWFYE
ncbi:MAG: hypothetical protein A2Y40_10410 [Candidatus Margulisbacteria bacterium GWF2_35_9]|nr:MAG: hypothetical protein A2Y40_10410 [Candidatus Margulisbacteria bacterium GWF2_35_9]